MRIEMMTLSRASCDVLHINNEWPHSIHFIPPKSHVVRPFSTLALARSRHCSLLNGHRVGRGGEDAAGGRAEQIGASASGVEWSFGISGVTF